MLPLCLCVSPGRLQGVAASMAAAGDAARVHGSRMAPSPTSGGRRRGMLRLTCVRQVGAVAAQRSTKKAPLTTTCEGKYTPAPRKQHSFPCLMCCGST
jgi:hypothetical protein